MASKEWRVYNPSGSRRVIVTKELPGDRWLNILTAAECKVDICTSPDVLSSEEIIAAIGDRCDGAIGQLTEPWGEDLYAALKAGGGTADGGRAAAFGPETFGQGFEGVPTWAATQSDGTATVVYVDLKRGEVLVTDGRRIVVASTAAGPAFEGAQISAGQRAAHDRSHPEQPQLRQGPADVAVVQCTLVVIAQLLVDDVAPPARLRCGSVRTGEPSPHARRLDGFGRARGRHIGYDRLDNCPIGKVANLFGHNGETLARLTRTCGFNRRVESQQVSLIGNVIYHLCNFTYLYCLLCERSNYLPAVICGFMYIVHSSFS